MSAVLRCLVLDDDRDWLELIRRALASSRVRVDVLPYLEAEAALALLRHTRVDVVLSDIRMPHMDGFAFLRELRRFDRKTPVIFVSSDVMSADDAVRHGANGFVRKGALNAKLTLAIEEIVVSKPASAADPLR